jgi:hypothetical protein
LSPNSLNIDIGLHIEIDVDIDIDIEIDIGARSTPLSFLSEWFAPGRSTAPSSEGNPKSKIASDGNAGCERPGRTRAKHDPFESPECLRVVSGDPWDRGRSHEGGGPIE